MSNSIVRSIFSFFLFTFLSFTPLQGYDHQVAVTMIFKNCSTFLKEWIEFHLLVGVDHFYLYDNSSTDHPLDVLQPYIDNGVVTLIDWPDRDRENWGNDRFAWIKTTQAAAYNHSKEAAAGKVKWMAFIDSDEFLVPMDEDTLLPIFNRYDDHNLIEIRWVQYGTSGVYEIPPQALMVELLTKKGLNQPKKKCFKSIAKPDKVIFFRGAHRCAIRDWKWDVHPPIEEIRINHYTYRTVKYLLETKRGLTTGQEGKAIHADPSQLKHFKDDLSDIEDRAMDRFIPALRLRMGFDLPQGA